MKRCLLDLDGVLVNFVHGAMKLHGRSDPFDEGFTEFEFNSHWGLSANTFFADMGRKFWRELEWMPDGKAIFKLIDNAFGPEHTCILTSPIMTEGCLDGKMAWIKENLPRAYHRKFLIGPAKEFCAGADRVLVDDRNENIDSFVLAGGHGFLIPRPWNRNRSLGISAVDFLSERLSNGNVGIRVT